MPAGRIRVQVHLRREDEPRRALLIRTAEHCCVVMQTLRGGVKVDVAVGEEEVRDVA